MGKYDNEQISLTKNGRRASDLKLRGFTLETLVYLRFDDVLEEILAQELRHSMTDDLLPFQAAVIEERPIRDQVPVFAVDH